MTTPTQKPRPIPANVLVPVREHVDFVVRACDAYDAGYTSEITRCAVALRALYHSPAPYLSWLARAEGLHGGFLSTALPRDAEGVGRYGSLVSLLTSPVGRFLCSLGFCVVWTGLRSRTGGRTGVIDDINGTIATRRCACRCHPAGGTN